MVVVKAQQKTKLRRCKDLSQKMKTLKGAHMCGPPQGHTRNAPIFKGGACCVSIWVGILHAHPLGYECCGPTRAVAGSMHTSSRSSAQNSRTG